MMFMKKWRTMEGEDEEMLIKSCVCSSHTYNRPTRSNDFSYWQQDSMVEIKKIIMVYGG
jgi:hypothetical protein